MKVIIKTTSGKTAAFLFCYFALVGVSFDSEFLGEDLWIIRIDGITREFTNELIRFIGENCSEAKIERA